MSALATPLSIPEATAVPGLGALGDVPAVLILNMYHSGLGIARALSGKGMRVVGLSADPKIYGNFTRFCEVRRAPNSQDAPKELLETLRNMVDEFDGAVVFPTRDADVLFLDQFRSELEMYCLAIPAKDALWRAMDKYRLVLAARESGVPTPRTVEVGSARDLKVAASEVGFPCVLKPIRAYQWRIGDAWHQVGARKAVVANNLEELRNEYAKVSSVTPHILVQEWVPGSDGNIVILGGYASHTSELVSYFTARKLLQSPSGCGTGCIVESEYIPEIVEHSRKLLRALRYQGIAEVEYKLDAASGEFKLIEINTRHWDQHQLGQASGINVTWVAYCDLTGGVVPMTQPPILPVKWIAEETLFIHALRALYRGEMSMRDLWQKLSGRKVYSIFAWNDPIPALRYGMTVVVPEIAAAIAKKLWKGKSL